MTTDLNKLIQNFYDYFVGLYRKSGAPGADTSPAFLAFESIGTAITSDMFELADWRRSPINWRSSNSRPSPTHCQYLMATPSQTRPSRLLTVSMN